MPGSETGGSISLGNLTFRTLPSPFAGPDSVTSVIPFTRAGNLIILQGTADSTSGNFILDTGAQHLVLNIIYFRQYPKIPVKGTERTSVSGTAAPAIRTQVKNFAFGEMKFVRPKADLIDLGHIENTKGIRILGLLGMELFRQCELIIDYENSLLYVHQIAKKQAQTYRSKLLADTTAYQTVPIDLKDNRIVARLVMEGKNLDFIIDCGAETNLLDSRLSNKVFENVIITGRVLVNGTGTKKVEALTGTANNLTLGNQAIGSMPVLITNLGNTCFSYNGCIQGVLGFDFLSFNKNKIGFNFVTRKMYIWK
ncbi:hypothetical protein GU926_01460 [Nibribacter ruber]|uniref:Peptidase A2 domain-containing protein n=1 Tax=Nibribacter ruber TaxID=2698458 RepID=A0A6P1NV19_9BACT|nr:retropepsin-like aspartic protease [Nibribacter ruber]QHL86184.1 hypothetical protein GU926_01460 [Nibribacter ruber]